MLGRGSLTSSPRFPHFVFEFLLQRFHPRFVVSFRDPNGRVSEEHGYVLNLDALFEQRHRERVAEPVRVRVLDLGQLEHRIEIP